MKQWTTGCLVSALFACGLAWAESAVKPELPALPIHFNAPFANIETHDSYSSATEFEALLETYGYNLDAVRDTKLVPRVFAINIPHHMAKLPVPEKTSTFIRLLLPNVVKVNEDIAGIRAEIITLKDKSESGAALSGAESEWLAALANDYGLDDANFDDLLLRVDSVPVAMVMAQGIDESGWGTSHFAIEGIALYGQHLASKGGKSITSASGNVKVAAFDNIYHSTASYIHNLNATRAYASFRESRQEMRQASESMTGMEMVEALSEYSERGQDYVNDLKNIIRHYKLDSFDDVALGDTADPVLVTFVE